MDYAIHDESGRLHSVASIIADKLPDGWTAVELPGKPRDDQMWDAVQRAFVQRPAKVIIDRLDDFLADADVQAIVTKLNATERQKLRTILVRCLETDGRYRTVSETVEATAQ